MFSIVATETSLLTFMSLPGIGFRDNNLFFLQLALGYIIGRILSAYFLSTFASFSIIMELLIEEFLIHFPLILSLILQFKLSIESSKGI